MSCLKPKLFWHTLQSLRMQKPICWLKNVWVFKAIQICYKRSDSISGTYLYCICAMLNSCSAAMLFPFSEKRFQWKFVLPFKRPSELLQTFYWKSRNQGRVCFVLTLRDWERLLARACDCAWECRLGRSTSSSPFWKVWVLWGKPPLSEAGQVDIWNVAALGHCR